ncbi:8-oxo-dGTP pyrophosphatase MutT (NUDIX family) [Arthrobacter sp. 1088]|uniref:NUDIX hydrolase n=1 Tax=Arthrobacter sp. 1088 TaxID=2817768 RepID=UPI002862DCDD|nr:NUDIX domain-containing protein [Arthrobacter sp. 1088]MDR6685861.1 8-oxo-dGTP pyrophosphatase MutT (NUDIX family) [Arthrobacter sp. 1088]
MGAPEFILKLREKIGNDPLWLPAVRGVVFDDDGRVLLCQRADNHHWTVITGILEPGEHPAPGLVREIFEETAVVAETERIIAVGVVGPVTFPNGDICDFLDITFRCRYVSGEAQVNDDESIAVGWFGLDELPDMSEGNLQAIRLATEPEGPVAYQMED